MAKVRTIHSFLYLPVEVTEETVARWRSEAENGSQYAKAKLKNYEDGFTVDFMDNLTEPVCQVTASGGVSSPTDVKNLLALGRPNLRAAIVGKALYDGRATLRVMNEAADGKV